MHCIQLSLYTIKRRFWFLLFLVHSLILLLLSTTVSAQQINNFEITKVKLVETLKKRYIDTAFMQSIDRFYLTTCDSLLHENFSVDGRPGKEILTRLFEVSIENIETKSLSPMQVTALNHNFLSILKTYKKKPLIHVCMNMHATQNNILQSVFSGLLVGDSIKTYAGLQEMLYNPYLISSRIELPEYKAFRDTLFYTLANGAPEVLLSKLTVHDPFYAALLEKSDNKTVIAVSKIAPDKYYDMIIPFSMALFEERITADQIKDLVLLPKDYYHAFVMEIIGLHKSNNAVDSSFLNESFLNLNKKFANYYFIKQINDLHESPDAVRFAVLNGMSATDLYFLLLGGSSELVLGGASALYTSSFLYVYKKFLNEVSKEGLDKFLDDIGYYEFDRFIVNISDYGLVDDMVHKLNEEKVAGLLEKYLTRLVDKQYTDNEIVLNAMAMAELLYEINHHHTIAAILVNRINKIDTQLLGKESYLYDRIYRGFKDILLNKGEYTNDKIYDVLDIKRLQSNKSIVEASFFYDDEDGFSSFDNCTRTFDMKIWNREDKGNYIVYSSRIGNNMRVYMNKPGTSQGCDSSQAEMLQAIDREGYKVTCYIHRGHSYHLLNSLNKMTSSAQFVFLGACGGYNQVLKVFQFNPDVNIIATRGVSSRLINDPMLARINSDILNNKDIVWDKIWPEFTALFKSDYVKDLFSSYIQPNRYIGVKFIRKVFNY